MREAKPIWTPIGYAIEKDGMLCIVDKFDKKTVINVVKPARPNEPVYSIVYGNRCHEFAAEWAKNSARKSADADERKRQVELTGDEMQRAFTEVARDNPAEFVEALQELYGSTDS